MECFSTNVLAVSISKSHVMRAVSGNTSVLTLWRCGAQESWTVLIFDSNTLFREAAWKSRTGIVTFTCRAACGVHLETILADLGTNILVAGTREAAALRNTCCKTQAFFSARI
jgi:hypothetical protein